MAQNRKPPSFQEYAASILANKEFRLMSLSERGLLFTMRLECWENQNLPSNQKELASYLRCEINDFEKVITERVKSFFIETEGSYICPELENYRQHIKTIRESQSSGGKKGAAKTNKRWKEIESGNPQVTRDSLVQFNSVQLSSEQSLESENINDEFVRDYERASNGS